MFVENNKVMELKYWVFRNRWKYIRIICKFKKKIWEKVIFYLNEFYINNK